MKAKSLSLVFTLFFASSLISCDKPTYFEKEGFTEIVDSEKEIIMEEIFSNYPSFADGDMINMDFNSIYSLWNNNQETIYEGTFVDFDIICGYIPKDSPSLKKFKQLPPYKHSEAFFTEYHKKVNQNEIITDDIKLFYTKNEDFQFDTENEFFLFAYSRVSYLLKGETKNLISPITRDIYENYMHYNLQEKLNSNYYNSKILVAEKHLQQLNNYTSVFSYSGIVEFVKYSNEFNNNYVKAYYMSSYDDPNDRMNGYKDFIKQCLLKQDEENKNIYYLNYQTVKELMSIQK